MNIDTGDRGQRYEIWCDEWKGGPAMQIGWSENPDAFAEMVRLHPSWTNHRVIDRQTGKLSFLEIEVLSSFAIPNPLSTEDRLLLADILHRCEAGGNDGADVYEAEELIKHLCAKYNIRPQDLQLADK